MGETNSSKKKAVATSVLFRLGLRVGADEEHDAVSLCELDLLRMLGVSFLKIRLERSR